MTQAYAADLTVIGVGNLLWADEGFGVQIGRASCRERV